MILLSPKTCKSTQHPPQSRTFMEVLDMIENDTPMLAGLPSLHLITLSTICRLGRWDEGA